MARTTTSRPLEATIEDVPGVRGSDGESMGRLTVIDTFKENGRTMARCSCSCGNGVVTRLTNVKRGDVKSCGCLKRERATALGHANKKHGHASSWGAGKGPSPEYKSWESMKRRCLSPASPDYPNYGGRGITVCDEWRDSFGAFLADMGPRPRGHTLDRIDPNGGYTPKNCRWSTAVQQARSKRNMREVEYQGRKMILSELAKETGVPYQRLYERIVRRGWNIERAVSEPKKARW